MNQAAPRAAARIERQRRYPTDLTDVEWEQIKPLLQILNAIRYIARSGGGWHMLPVGFGRWETVYW